MVQYIYPVACSEVRQRNFQFSIIFLGLRSFFFGLGKGNNGLILFQNSSEIL